MNAELLTKAKSLGFSDRQIAHLTGQTEDAVRADRKKLGLVPSYRLVDTCAPSSRPTLPIITRPTTGATTRSNPATARR